MDRNYYRPDNRKAGSATWLILQMLLAMKFPGELQHELCAQPESSEESDALVFKAQFTDQLHHLIAVQYRGSPHQIPDGEIMSFGGVVHHGMVFGVQPPQSIQTGEFHIVPQIDGMLNQIEFQF